MRINVVTTGRFHVLDLARELAALGHDVRFYSCVPKARAVRFGLPPRCHRRAAQWLAPALLAASRGPRAFRAAANRALIVLLDRWVASTMQPCDVLIGMSGLCLASARAARLSGAKVFLERGSRHILSQKEILESMPAAPHATLGDWEVARELAGYEEADVVVVPSAHVERSFVERGFDPRRLFRNPFGVDLAMFRPTGKPANVMPRAIMVGAWSMRKGCDLLWEACAKSGRWTLLHVGPLADAPVPESPLFEHRDPVQQWELAKHFAEADLFVLASREEGLSLVQAQALACGLPVVCTDRTGGADLREHLGDPRWIIEAPHDDVDAFGSAVERAISLAATQSGRRDILGAARERFGWAAYGARYDAELARRCSR